MTKSTRDGRSIESDPTEPFRGLCKFVEWWNQFQAQECQGIEARFELGDHMTAKFCFRKGSWYFERTYDLMYCIHPKPSIIPDLRISVSTLRTMADATKPNESES